MRQIQIQRIRQAMDSAVESKDAFVAEAGKLDEELVRFISKDKNEPEWMLQKRLKALELFNKTPMPSWGPDLSKLDMSRIYFYRKPNAKQTKSWEEVPPEMKKTFDALGIPEAEQKALGGAGAQWDSNVVYHKLKEEFESKGVIFEDMDVAVQKYPELVKKYFMTKCIPISDHKFIMLHAAVWSGGTFIYIPKGVKVSMPLQAYFRMNAKLGGQFEHTLIIAEPGSEVNYIEGCSAPQFGEEKALHAGGVEIYVGEGARARYSSVENWSTSTFNLNTKRAIVEKNGVMEWINGNMGCLPEDATIYTDKGIKKMGDINGSEFAYSLDTKTRKLVKRKVLAKVCTGIKELYALSVAGRTVKATAEHPFLVINRKEVAENRRKGAFVYNWKPLKILKKGDLIAIPKSIPIEGADYKLPTIDVSTRTIQNSNQYGATYLMSSSYKYKQVTIPEQPNEDFMWLMGFYLGDGNLWTHNNSAKITFAIPKWSEMRGVVKETAKTVFGCDINYERDYAISINSYVIGELIKRAGFGGTAKEKRIPAWVFGLPLSQRLSLIAGLVDSGGHIGNGAYVTSCNKNLLEDLQLLAISCGIGTSTIFDHGKERDVTILGYESHASNSYRILMNGKNIKNLNLKDTLKKEKLAKVKSYVSYSSSDGLNFSSKTNDEFGFAKVRSIKPAGKEPVYDIEVEDAHNFIANGVLVHNSCTTMLYPCSILKGAGARSDSLGIAYAGRGQNQDTGSKVYHLAPNTSSTIKMKSISKDGGICTYRGLVKVAKGAKNSKVAAVCDALILDRESVSNTIPNMDIGEESVQIAHEAKVGKLSAEKIFYLMSRGLKEEEAMQMIVSGFIEPVIKELPLEYAVELNKLIQLEMVGAVG